MIPAAAAVPLTHSAGLVAHAPRAAAARAVHLIMYPFVGGRLHAIFHTLAWVRQGAHKAETQNDSLMWPLLPPHCRMRGPAAFCSFLRAPQTCTLRSYQLCT